MAHRDTSLLSFSEIQPVLGERQRQVLHAIKIFPDSTALELAKYMHYDDPNAIRPRIHELYELGLIVDNDRRKCLLPPHRISYTWRVKA